MKFKAKLRKLGTSKGIIIPANLLKEHYNIGDEIELDIIMFSDKNEEVPQNIIMPKMAVDDTDVISPENNPNKNKLPQINPSRFELCPKHKGSMKATCGCK